MAVKTIPPCYRAPYDDHDIAAVRALFAGKASEGQQKLVVAWLINSGTNYYDLSFQMGGQDGCRATDFMEGRRFVGAQLLKLSKLPTKK